MKRLPLLLMAGVLLMAAFGCTTGSNSSESASSVSLAGNWQFTTSSPTDNSFVGGIVSGFLLQNQQSVTGSVYYSISLPSSSSSCNSGVASVTGTLQGQNVTLTAQASGQTFTLTGTLSANGSTIMGTYSSTAGPQVKEGVCGTAQSGLQWSAIAVPPLSGGVQGFFHSITGIGNPINQDLPVTGVLTQGDNIGASSATVTGYLTFQGYSCLGGAAAQTISVNGGISGQNVVLQLFSHAGVNIGQVGYSMFGQSVSNVQNNPVVYQSVPGGYVVENTNVQAGYGGYYITTSVCTPDSGNLCLAVGSGNSTACTQPISLSPASLTFPTQLVGSTATTQTITLTNTDPSSATLTGLSLTFNPGSGVAGFSDFNGLPNFLEQDSCATSPGSSFSLQPQQSCTITVSFSPQESCPWALPQAGVAAAQCPPFGNFSLSGASLTVNSPTSADSNNKFSVPISGVGQSVVIPSTPERDFGSEALGESAPPQTLSFTNTGLFPVQILGKASPQNACSTTGGTLLPPLTAGSADGLRVVQGSPVLVETAPGGRPELSYFCDVDPSSNQANFQLSSDSCTGTLLYPGDLCTVTMTYVPQPATAYVAGLDYFLELNSLQCSGSTVQPNCEIDSGRFPVEIKANPASPLRISPAAGLDFAPQGKGTSSTPLSITLTNDPQDRTFCPTSATCVATVNFKGNVVTGNFSETDNCGVSLASGSSCTMNIIFTPGSSGFQQGTITINYTVTVASQPTPSSPQVQTIRLRGVGQ